MTVTPDEDEFTELVDADFPRVDLVGKGANGIPRFLIAKQDASAGLLDPAYVRDLIAKAEPETPGRERVTMPSGVTLSGSPADIAAFIHKAALRAETGPGGVAGYEAVVKAKYSADDKRKMLAAGHAIKNDDGDPAYPIGDKDDLGKAIRAVGRGGSDHDHIRAYVIRRAKALGASSQIPDNWNSDGSLKGDSVSKTATEPVAKDAGDVLDAQTDDGVDGMDPTVPLAVPDEDAPGDPTDPGSPAWEAIDAATACKWTSILSRARVAIDLLAEREMLEAASADPDDMDNAWDLQDVCCAIDYAIGVLAPFAVAEQSEADCGADAMMVSKAMAGFDPAPLERAEALAAVMKAGRVLSASNEAEIRSAAASLNKVLASLPQAPSADDIAKEKKEAAVAATTETTAAPDAPAQVAKEDATPEAQAAANGPVDGGGTTGLGEPRETGPPAAAPGDGPQASRPGDAPGRQVIKGALQVAVYLRDGSQALTDPGAIVTDIAKADGDDGDGKVTMQAVFDQHGNLVGVVDASAITPVAGAGGKPDDGEADAKPAEPGEAKAAEDLSPAPAADAGTPADGTPGDDVSKQAEPAAAKDTTDARTVLKSIVAELAGELGLTGPAEDVAKQADVAGHEEQIKELVAKVAALEAQPAPPKVFSNGQVPPAHQMRGQDQGAPPVDVAKAAERKVQLYRAHDAGEQNEIAKAMQGDAVAMLTALRAGAPVPTAPQHT